MNSAPPSLAPKGKIMLEVFSAYLTALVFFLVVYWTVYKAHEIGGYKRFRKCRVPVKSERR